MRGFIAFFARTVINCAEVHARRVTGKTPRACTFSERRCREDEVTAGVLRVMGLCGSSEKGQDCDRRVRRTKLRVTSSFLHSSSPKLRGSQVLWETKRPVL